MGESLGCLADKAHTEPFGNAAHALLGGLHQERHSRVVVLYQAAEADSGVYLLVLRPVALVDDKAHIGDDSYDVGLVAPVEGDGIVVVGRHKDFRSGTLAHNLLLFVQGVAYRLAVLLEDKFVEQRQIGGVVAHRILHQEYGPHPHLQYVLIGVELVLQELDDGDDDVRAVVPAEHIIDAGAVAALDVTVDFPRERAQQNYRSPRPEGLGLTRETEDIQFPDIVHRDDQVELPVFPLEHLEGVDC